MIWISQAYLLASTVGLLLAGRLSDIYGKVRLYVIGFLLFTIGSAICSLSQNFSELIMFRVAQGIGAAVLMTNSSAIVTDAAPKGELERCWASVKPLGE